MSAPLITVAGSVAGNDDKAEIKAKLDAAPRPNQIRLTLGHRVALAQIALELANLEGRVPAGRKDRAPPTPAELLFEDWRSLLDHVERLMERQEVDADELPRLRADVDCLLHGLVDVDWWERHVARKAAVDAAGLSGRLIAREKRWQWSAADAEGVARKSAQLLLQVAAAGGMA